MSLTFILGGARSGKSAYAEKLAAEFGDGVIYCATAEIYDDEMRERVRQHQSRRPAAWRTVEAPRSAAEKLAAALEERPAKCVLLDCLSILTSNVLLGLPEDICEADAFAALRERELDALYALVKKTPEVNFMIVSNEVGMDVVPATKLGRIYRDLLGRANQSAAAEADAVWLLVAGIPLKIKG